MRATSGGGTRAGIEDRLEDLERTIRRWRRAAGILVGLIAALAGSAWTVQSLSRASVVAKEVVLADEGGATRARLALDEGGAPFLELRGPKGTRRARLGFEGAGAVVLGLFDEEGEERVGLGVAADRSPRLQLYGDGKRGGVEILARREGSSGVYLHRESRTRLAMEVDAASRPRVALRDGEGAVRVGIAVWEEGQGTLSFLNGQGATRVGIGEREEGSAGLALYDAGGMVRGEVSLGADGTPRMALYDEAGRPLRGGAPGGG